MEKLRQIIERNDTKLGHAFDLFIQTLIILSLISFSIETLPNLSESSRRMLRAIEVVTVSIFTVEYLLRILVAQKKLKFIFSFFGLIDFFAILPFYLSTGIDLRAIRAFRLLRLFRAFKLLRYNRAIARFQNAFESIREELILFFSTAALLLFFAAVVVYYCERDAQPEVFASIFHSLWWAVVTLTTVGYGDIYPVTALGKVFTFFVLMVGLGIVAVPAGLMSSALSNAQRDT
jgi:voltage-gated potassium channel